MLISLQTVYARRAERWLYDGSLPPNSARGECLPDRAGDTGMIGRFEVEYSLAVSCAQELEPRLRLFDGRTRRGWHVPTRPAQPPGREASRRILGQERAIARLSATHVVADTTKYESRASGFQTLHVASVGIMRPQTSPGVINAAPTCPSPHRRASLMPPLRFQVVFSFQFSVFHLVTDTTKRESRPQCCPNACTSSLTRNFATRHRRAS
jgi:hypothetical protein